MSVSVIMPTTSSSFSTGNAPIRRSGPVGYLTVHAPLAYH
jgi:hypothetical protein